MRSTLRHSWGKPARNEAREGVQTCVCCGIQRIIRRLPRSRFSEVRYVQNGQIRSLRYAPPCTGIFRTLADQIALACFTKLAFSDRDDAAHADVLEALDFHRKGGMS